MMHATESNKTSTTTITQGLFEQLRIEGPVKKEEEADNEENKIMKETVKSFLTKQGNDTLPDQLVYK